MLFDSPIYIVFLVVVVALYWRLAHRGQNVLLLGASYLFYGWWDWRFLGLILVSTVVDYVCALAIAGSDVPRRRKSLLAFSLTLNLLFLGFFKYFNFFIDTLHPALAALGLDVPEVALRILLPPGISFYTFQAVAYIVDVYFGRIQPARSMVDYALFISLFPHLIAGPIQRPSHLLPQVQLPRRFDPATVFDGLMLIVSGLFRKCVVANNCALVANAAFNGTLGPPGLATVALGTYAFAWQIYGDFSGYSDIARGSAQLMGFHFMVNFQQPYFSRSLQDFWRRWHISLSTWLRDYVYIPLGGNRHGEVATNRNLIATMLIGGLWHGANWTFVLWGAIHGFGLAIERQGRRLLGLDREEPERTMSHGAHAWAQRIAIFHVVCIAWIFFRAQHVSDAFAMIASMRSLDWRPVYLTAATFLAIFIVPMVMIDLHMASRRDEYLLASASHRTRIVAALGLLGLMILFSASDASAFIYFQF